MRRILHIDMDGFFAAVEEMRHPELKGKHLVIGGDGDPTRIASIIVGMPLV